MPRPRRASRHRCLPTALTLRNAATEQMPFDLGRETSDKTHIPRSAF